MPITDNSLSNNSVAGIAVSGADHTITGNTLANNGAGLDNRAQLMFFSAGTAAANCTVTHNTFRADTGYQFIVAESGNCSGHSINFNTYTYQGATGSGFYWPCSSADWMDFSTWQSSTGLDADSTLERISPLLTAQYLLLLLR
jgi:parallel beta-helix repeat protein